MGKHLVAGLDCSGAEQCLICCVPENREVQPPISAELSETDFFCGLGYWTRANIEQCLLATRGKPPRMAKDVRRLIILPRREHSRKPDETYDRIERLAHGPYLEVFARQSRCGWDAMGKEISLFDNGPVETRNRPSNMVRPRSRTTTYELKTQQLSGGDLRAFKDSATDSN